MLQFVFSYLCILLYIFYLSWTIKMIKVFRRRPVSEGERLSLVKYTDEDRLPHMFRPLLRWGGTKKARRTLGGGNLAKNTCHTKSLLGGAPKIPRSSSFVPFRGLGERTGTDRGSESHGQFVNEATFHVKSGIFLFHSG